MIFISYSHDDDKCRIAFLRMIKPLTRQYGVTCWSDVEIQAGEYWRKKIDAALDRTSVAVLLVSDAFLDSDFIQTVELPYFIKGLINRGLELIWVLVSDCLWEHSQLNDIKAANDINKPIDSLSAPQQKTAWKAVGKQLHEALKRYERPHLVSSLNGSTVNRREPELKVLARPARRRTEIFVRPHGSDQFWWHQYSIPRGKRNASCTFGDQSCRAGHRFDLVALTTDQNAMAKSKTLPQHRTRSPAVTLVRK